MSSKFNSALYAGLAGGVLIAFLLIIAIYLSIVGVVSTLPAVLIMALIAGGLMVVLLALTGAMAVSLAKKVLAGPGEAQEVSLNAGLLAGIISGIALIFLSFMLLMVTTSEMTDIAKSLLTLQNTTCIGTPILILSGVIVATIGGTIYYNMKVKKTS